MTSQEVARKITQSLKELVYLADEHNLGLLSVLLENALAEAKDRAKK
ncbi:MAG: hypothetical protein ABJZ62_01125 [Hyphomicrobiales bacterium]